MGCLLYTSDAADDGYSVDLGGRRIIKKIFFKQKTAYEISEGLVGSEMCIRDRIITGEREKIQYEESYDVNPERIALFDIDSLHSEDKLTAIKNFGEIVGLDVAKCSFSKEEDVEHWLYSELVRLKPLLKIMDNCRGRAVPFAELASNVFPKITEDIAQKAASVLLSVAPMARNKEGQVLFPSRLHMMFRGTVSYTHLTLPTMATV